MGMIFFHSLPIPEFAISQKGIKQELDYCERYQTSNLFSFLYIPQNNYVEEVN